ncbi:MAG: phytanoyl-CoA dioxygenase family protein [Parvibaculaceae bacterium]
MAPIQVLEREEANRCRLLLERLVQDRETDPRLADIMYYKSHLVFRWFAELCRHPKILDAVESLLGPNLLLWNSSFLPKAPNSKTWFTWHQDATYWGLQPPRILSVWLALSEATSENGCLRVIPGTHLEGQLPHENTFDPTVGLPRGQQVTSAVDEGRALDLPLAPGEASLHHVLVVHGSGSNQTDGWRLGCNMTYLATEVRPQNGPESAVLVRGKDIYGHFSPEVWPDGDMTEAGLAAHAHAMSSMGTRRSEPGKAKTGAMA